MSTGGSNESVGGYPAWTLINNSAVMYTTLGNLSTSTQKVNVAYTGNWTESSSSPSSFGKLYYFRIASNCNLYVPSSTPSSTSSWNGISRNSRPSNMGGSLSNRSIYALTFSSKAEICNALNSNGIDGEIKSIISLLCRPSSFKMRLYARPATSYSSLVYSTVDNFWIEVHYDASSDTYSATDCSIDSYIVGDLGSSGTIAQICLYLGNATITLD